MKKSTQVALGGLSASLCLVIMFLTGVVPFATLSLPAIAGGFLVIVVIENSRATAWMVYGAVAMLSLFIVPDKEAALIFVAFFGYYPIIKERLEALRSKVWEWAAKLVIFNVAIISSNVLFIYIIGVGQVAAELGEYGIVGLTLLLVLANATFVMYDLVLSKFILVYVHVLRAKLLRRLK